jgi:glutathione S-transferase
MSLTLFFHPLASYCQKVLVALYENDTPFTGHVVDLGDPAVRAEYQKVWPFAKMPVLRDEARGRIVPEASIIIEYLDQYHPGRVRLIPEDADLARETRLRDRVFDLYVDDPMAKIVTDKLRPPGKHDPHGVEQASALLRTAYRLIDEEMATRTWAVGDRFSMADCAAAPALFYAGQVLPFGDGHPHLTAYLGRLIERPSFSRALAEMQPYRDMFPG